MLVDLPSAFLPTLSMRVKAEGHFKLSGKSFTTEICFTPIEKLKTESQSRSRFPTSLQLPHLIKLEILNCNFQLGNESGSGCAYTRQGTPTTNCISNTKSTYWKRGVDFTFDFSSGVDYGSYSAGGVSNGVFGGCACR